jgi:hypothetical protein
MFLKLAILGRKYSATTNHPTAKILKTGKSAKFPKYPSINIARGIKAAGLYRRLKIITKQKAKKDHPCMNEKMMNVYILTARIILFLFFCIIICFPKNRRGRGVHLNTKIIHHQLCSHLFKDAFINFYCFVRYLRLFANRYLVNTRNCYVW